MVVPELREVIEILERTPRVLSSLLTELSTEWTEAPDTPGGWSPRIVLGHLIHGEETDWIPRARIILEAGESRTFEAYDRDAQFQCFGDWQVDRLLERFCELRACNLESLVGFRLTPAQLALTGNHPALGPVTLGQLLATWVAHDLSHLAQIVRAMTRRYRAAVGPWSEYLSLMNA